MLSLLIQLFIATSLSLVSQAQTIPLKDFLARPATPIKLTVKLGPKTITQKISAVTGGTIKLTLKNGDQIELNLPAKSLPYDEEIILQEVEQITHSQFPNGARFSSVEISPNGLLLNVPAILTFKPKKAFPLKTLTTFSSDAAGNEVQASLLYGKPLDNDIKIGLLHFSNYSVTDGPSMDEVILNGTSKNAQTRANTWLARELAIAEQKGESTGAVRRKYIKDFFDQIIYPEVMGVSSCSNAMSVVTTYTNWSHQAWLMGFDESEFFPPDFELDMQNIFKVNAEKCYEDAVKACYVDHRPVEVLKYIFAMSRQTSMFEGSTVFEKFEVLRKKCGKFRFFMESDIWAGDTRDDGSGITAQADFKFEMSVSRDPFEGEIDVIDTYIGDSVGSSCNRTSLNTKPSMMFLNNFLLEEMKGEPNFMVVMGNLVPHSVAKFRCTDPGPPPISFDIDIPPEGNANYSYWGGFFKAMHGPDSLNELEIQTETYFIRNWDLRHQSVYATKSYNFSFDGAHETTTMTIYHTPEPLN